MFSSIIELIQKIQEAKLRKQKKETKKVVKKEEKKIEEKEEKSLVEAKSKAKKTKEVKKETLKEIKLKAKVLALKLLKYVVKIIESFVKFLITTFGVMGFFVILVVVVLMIAIYGLLHIDFDLPSGDIYNGTNEDCIQGSTSIVQAEFDMSQFSQLSGTLTEYQKNLMRCFQVYSELFNGTFGKEMWKEEYPEIRDTVGIPNISAFLLGFAATENGMNFNNSNKNILEYTANFEHNSYGYGGFGLETAAKLEVFAPDIATKVKEKYPQPVDYTGYDTDFVPYAIAMQTYEMANSHTNYSYFTLAYNFVKENDSEIENIFSEYGIIANKEKLKNYLVFFGTSCYYHGGGMNLKQVSIWSALWSATSENDANREFLNIKILSDGYDESTARTKILGVGGRNNCTAKWNQNVTPYFKINGEEINVTLWTWVRDNCSNQTYFDSTAKEWLDSKAEFAGNGIILNAHYGLFAYLVGQKMLNDLGISMPIVSGGNSEDCDCVESGGSGSLDDIDLSSVKIGEAQGPWDDDLLNKINALSGFKTYFGRTFVGESELQNEEEWRKNSKWKVPYYFQSDSAGIKFQYGQIHYHTNFGNLNACATHMMSFLMSAATGKMINPVEAMAVGVETGIFERGSGLFMKIPPFENLKKYGINITQISGSGNSTNKEKVDACLNNGGLVGIYSNNPSNKFVRTQHYFVITEKVGDNYNVYAATGFPRDTGSTHTWSEITLGAQYFYLTENINRSSYISSGNNGFVDNSNEAADITAYRKNECFAPDPGTEIKIPTGEDDINYTYTSNRSMMAWSKVTSTTSKQYRFREEIGGAQFDADGLGFYNGRYVVAVVGHIGAVGDYIDVYQEDGTVIPCIVGEAKNYDDWTYRFAQLGDKLIPNTDKILSYGHLSGMSRYDSTKGKPPSTWGAPEEEPYGNKECPSTNIIEHIVKSGLSNENFNSIMQKLGFNKNITKIVNLGSYFNDPNFRGSSQNKSSVDCIPAKITNGPAAGMTNANETRDERWKRVMGDKNYSDYYLDSWTGVSARAGSTTWQPYVNIMQSNDVAKVSLKAWDLDSNKNWVSYDFDMLVNKNLASSIEAMFNELYALPEKDRTPIHKSLYEDTVSGVTYIHNGGCFSYYPRGGGSIHCIGAAIDINPDENPMPGQYGDIKNYKPGVDPYSIMDTSKLVEIFGKYGFERGRSYKDYMHFSYLESIEDNKNTYGG